MKNNVIILSEANSDLDFIYSYHLQKSFNNAKVTIFEILKAIKEVEGSSLFGISINNKVMPDIEYKVINLKEYIVFYRNDNNTTYINRILSKKRDLHKIQRFFENK